MAGGPIIGVDLGGTNMQIGLVDADNTVRARAKRKTKARLGFEAVLERVDEGIRACCDEAGVAVTDLAGVGMAVAAAVDVQAGLVLDAVNLGWADVPLADRLADRLGVPVVLDNDVNAAVYGEFVCGAGRGSRDLLGVWLGTGVGGGLILDGRIYYGHFGTAGEIGHMITIPGNPVGMRELEDLCSRTAIAQRLARLSRHVPGAALADVAADDPARIRARRIGQAYRDHDPVTVRVVDEAAGLLGLAVAGVVTLLSLGRVVLGGGLSEVLGAPFARKVQAAVRDAVFPARCRDVDVVITQLYADAGVVGAALIARDRLQGRPR